MGKSFSNDDHDPGDEDPTERVKRALLEVLRDEAVARCGCEFCQWKRAGGPERKKATIAEFIAFVTRSEAR